MEVEEDMFLVIVGDESSEGSSNQISAPISINQKSLDETKSIDDLLEMAERHGEYFEVQVKQEPEESETENSAEELLLQPRLIKPASNNYDDEEYILEDEEEDDQDLDNDTVGKREIHRHTMLKPSQRRSFVAELRQQHHELRDDKDLLINTLSEIMRSVKVPPLPKDYYIMDFNKPKCVECGATSDSIPAAGRHYQEKHGQRYLVCYACGVDFRSTTNLYKHEKRCVAPDAQVVLKARAACLGRKGRGRPFLSRPPRKHSDKFKFACSQCSARFQSKVALQSHEYLHRGERPFQCHVCPAAYTSNSALLRHAKIHTDVQFICDHCNRSFKVKAALVTHMDTHRPLRKYECVECGRRFAQRAAMLLHVNRDHRLLPPPCACQICPKRYPRMSLLKKHMKKAHGMTLMTRKMFSKFLPTMTDTHIEQAKVVLKSEAPSVQDIDSQYTKQESNDNLYDIHVTFDDETFDDETKCDEYNNSEIDTQSDTIAMEDCKNYEDIMKNNEFDPKSTKIFVIKNGTVINVNVCKNNLLTNSMVEVTEDSIAPEIIVGSGELKALSMPNL